MGRRGDDKRLDAILNAIAGNPGRRPGQVARQLGLDNKTVMRALMQLEERGDLLVEDERGRISVFASSRR